METAAVVQSIPIDQIKPNPWNRKNFDPAAMQDLVASIKEGGVREPLIVRPLSEDRTSKTGEEVLNKETSSVSDLRSTVFEIVSGNRRWLAAKEAGLAEVPCLVQTLSDQQVAEDDILLNIQREDIAPLELAKMIQAYVDQYKLTHDQAAAKFGKSRTWVTELIGFLSLPEEVTNNVNALTLAWAPLRALKRLSPEQQNLVAQELKGGSLKPEGVEKRCQGLSPKVSDTGKKRSASVVPEQSSDPLSALWPDIHSAAMGTLWWDVKFGPHKLPNGQPMNGWFFFAAPVDGQATQEALAGWFQQMANALAAGERIPKTEKVDPLLETSTSVSGLRSSDSAEPQFAELEELGRDGPGPIYAKLMPGSPLVEMMKNATWQEYGAKDVKDGLPQLLAALQKAKEYGIK